MSYSSSFPGLTLGLTPSALAIPLVDASYRNDSCARFEERTANPDQPGLALWVDYPDVRSEYHGTPNHYRYTLTLGIYGNEETDLLQTNSPAELTAAVLKVANERAAAAGRA